MQMQRPTIEFARYEQAKLVIKHTFLEFECIDEEESPRRRRKSDPAVAFTGCTEQCAQVAKVSEFTKISCEWEEPITPTTCVSSVNGDDDDDTSPFSPSSIDEDVSSQEGKFSFSGAVVDELLYVPQVAVQNAPMPVQNSTMSHHASIGWPQPSCSPTGPLLSTSPSLATEAWTTSAQAFATPQIQSQGLQKMGTDPQAELLTLAKTTLMVRNLPPSLSQPGLVQHFIEAGYGGLFDFVYMPMNFRGEGNFGYAFINFASHEVAAHVMMQMQPHDEDGEGTTSSDRWTSAWSSCQGLSDNVERYRNSPLMHELVPKDCKPALYDMVGNQVAFPSPTKTIAKPRIHWPSSKGASSSVEKSRASDTRKAAPPSDDFKPASGSAKQGPGRSQRQHAARQTTGFANQYYYHSNSR
jgi:hypothetical protein